MAFQLPFTRNDPEHPRFGPYTGIRRLGSGGMADVWLAKAPNGEEVAAKVVRPEHRTDARYLATFESELNVMRALGHRNIVRALGNTRDVHDAPVVLLEHVNGPNLGAIVAAAEKRPPLARHYLAYILAGACHGLHFAHTATLGTGAAVGLVHRDATLDNMLVDPHGVTKLIDFGVVGGAPNGPADDGMIAGKLAFVAPEQLRGEAYDTRADVFAIGMCLYRATTGRLPFQYTSGMLLYRERLSAPIKPPRTLDPSYPELLERIVLDALEPDPERRIATCRQLAQRLEAWAASVEPGINEEKVAAWLETLFPETYRTRSADGSVKPVPARPDPPAEYVDGRLLLASALVGVAGGLASVVGFLLARRLGLL